ncbi:MAG TPA: hypothetical protein VFT56_11730 [Sphingomonas sp.]|nr:hypothetical protein [Sphingomonas sp.]
MQSPFDDPRSEHRRHHHRRRRREGPPAAEAVEVKPDYLVLGLWAAIGVLFAIGAVAALLR